MKSITFPATEEWLETYPVQPLVYLMLTGEWDNEGRLKVKIGETAQLPLRYNKLRLGGLENLKIEHCIPCKSKQKARGLEAILHYEFQSQRTMGEFFWLYPEDIRLIKRCRNEMDWIALWNDGAIMANRGFKGLRRAA